MVEETTLDFDEVVEQFTASEPKFVEDEDPEAEAHEEPEATPEDDDHEEEAEGEEPDDEEEGEGGADGGDADGDDPGEEDPETEITVGSETRKVRLSELKQLYAAREEVETRAKVAAEQNRLVETQGLYLASLYEKRLQQAQANAAKYQNVDLFQAYRELDADEFETLKAAKEAAEAELATITSEAQEFMQNAMNTRRAYLREQAKQSIGAIRQAIPDWNDELYGKVRAYAVSQGMEPEVVNEIVDASAIIMMHKAMLYDDTKSKAVKVTQKVVKAPKKVVRKGEKTTDAQAVKQKRLIAQARASGDIDDVAEAFLAAHRS